MQKRQVNIPCCLCPNNSDGHMVLQQLNYDDWLARAAEIVKKFFSEEMKPSNGVFQYQSAALRGISGL